MGTEADAPANFGAVAGWSLERQPEFLAFLASLFGPYPFVGAGGVIDDGEFGFALEVQTRPFYSKYFFADPTAAADWVFVHELAHQWVGDSLAVESWSEVWLNEGFATYAEWLWAEHEGLATAQEIFDVSYGAYADDDPYWTLVIGDPGPAQLFDWPVYERGAMTLHQLRLAVGDEAFFRILRTWVASHVDGNVNTGQFIALAEGISGQQLDDLFDAWLYTGTRPVLPGSSAAQAREAAHVQIPVTYVEVLERLQTSMR